MKAYYNEFDPKAAAWLRELISAGLIAPGDVDTRSIKDISPHELTGYTQQHFFAGIGGWPYALRLAGWPDSRPVRTGSCPCQPFSQAGQGKGEKDDRHLWPVFRDLITFGEPTVTFGEQVASKAGREWLARVRADLEGLGYAVGAADLCAASASPEVAGWIWIPDELEPSGGTWIPASAGPPHIRQRLFWVADMHGCRLEGDPQQHRKSKQDPSDRDSCREHAGGCGQLRGVADAGHESARRGARPSEAEGGRAFGDAPGCGDVGRLGNANDPRPQGRNERGNRANELSAWASSVALACTDGKTRRIEPGSFPLAHGVSGRVGLLRGYGNAIVPQVAAEFIKAFVDVTA